MPKTSIKLNGPTMGARWQAQTHQDCDPAPLQAAVDAVEAQMSLWRPDSDLCRVNAAACGAWTDLPEALTEVLSAALQIGRASGGAFDIGLGDAWAAWGFGPAPASEPAILAARRPRLPVHELLELDAPNRRLCKHGPVTLDLNGIAKGYGVDRLTRAARAQGVTEGLFAIDGELRALGGPFPVAVEAPIVGHRAAHSMLALQDAAVATSGTYRHFVTVQGRRLSHLIDPATGMPLTDPPDQVTVLAQDCMTADAWAKVFMVLPPARALTLAAVQGVSVLVLGPHPFATGVFA
ncbi:FAD:protein FMN transferase [Rhodobacter sp. KR11]|uniref:FAD:protein FMN transferase n=1 Tax=Rhodobacter sp. KR11 TaxID=2974588 RepID=UPI002221DFD0|nr:FAD:protein FMN transferase [Rhodobacter sp. KR11]MCW1920061.1 FAD:protein FMN transferase [Rhodobacter sp. KR11]